MAGKAAFVESHLSGTRQSFCRVPSQPSAKKTSGHGPGNGDGALPSACSTRQSPKYTRQRLCRVPHSAMATLEKKWPAKQPLPRAICRALDKAFAECRASPRQRKRVVTAQETVTVAVSSANPDGTRQSFSFFLNSLPSAARAGTRQSFLFLFFFKFFLCRAPPGMTLSKVLNFF